MDKYIFFDDWYVESNHLGDSYGNGFSRDKNKHLLIQLMNFCKSNQDTDIDKNISEFEEELEDLLIISVNNDLSNLLEEERFKPKWKAEVPKVLIPEFSGFYIYKNNLIPVTKYFCRFAGQNNVFDKSILFLSKKKFPNLIQYCKESLLQEETDGFEFQVNSFEDDSLMEQYLSNPPSWLTDKGDTSHQREYLKKSALLEIYEKFELEVTSTPIGYVMPIED